MNDVRTVGAHMTPAAHVIAIDATLGEAQQRMREHSAQLLVVVEQGQPCGVLLERDLQVAHQLGTSFDAVRVRSVLSRASLSVKSADPVAFVARSMASRQATHALVLEGTRICGVLTVHDALHLLAQLLEEREGALWRAGDATTSAAPVASSGAETAGDPASAAWSNEQSGCSLLDEAYLLERVEHNAAELMRDARIPSHGLREAVRELHDSQATLLASEMRELAETRPDEGPLHRTRLEQLSDVRARHIQALATLMVELDRGTKPTSHIAGHALQAAAALRTYIEREREPLRFVS